MSDERGRGNRPPDGTPRSPVPGYTALRLIAEGGMGVVYEATRDSDGQRVALKVMSPGITDAEAFRRRFAREAEIAGSLKHPHVVPVVEAGGKDAIPYLAMEYIEGSDLEQRIRAGSLEPGEVLRIIAQVAAALDASHSQSLVHRDVKPANILLDQGGTAYLADFGLTRPTTGTRMTSTGVRMGTVDFMAPEQIEDRPVDARTDVYALAAVAFHALAGEVPFPRASEMAKLYAHVNDPRPALPERLSAQVRHVSPVIQRGMARDPAERHLSAGDFARAANAALTGTTVELPERVVATGEAAFEAAATRPLPGAKTGHQAHTVRIHRRGARRNALVAAMVLLIGVGAGAALALTSGGGAESAPQPVSVAKTSTAVAPPAPTETEVTEKAPPKPKPKPDPSDPRPDDLAIVLDAKSNVPTQLGPWDPSKDATVGAAQRAFGDEYIVNSGEASELCTFDWNEFGLTVNFVNLGGGDPCGADSGLAQTIQIDGRATARWRTLSGLRPGMPESRISTLYPEATKSADGTWWIVTAKNRIGSESYYPALAAVVSGGKVTGFELFVGAAGD